MPAVCRENGVRFFCFSNDGEEPPSIHVIRGHAHAKFWLIPPHLADADGFSPAELRRIRHIVEEGSHGFLEAWARACG
jgi:hypothetical protein